MAPQTMEPPTDMTAADSSGDAGAAGGRQPAPAPPPPTQAGSPPGGDEKLQPGIAPKGAPPPEVGRCTFFVAAKGRYCRFFAAPGKSRCGAHSESVVERVPCPLDPGHTVYANRIKQHLKICSKRRQEDILARQPFYRSGVNLASAAGGAEDRADAPDAAEGDAEALQRDLIARLEAAFPRAVAALRLPGAAAATAEEAAAEAEALLQRSVVAEAGGVAHAEKHDAQNEALASLLAARGFADGALVVEYGCGRAGLAAAVLAARPGARCVLVEREHRRHKAENRQEHRDENVLRLRLDIADFDLGALVGDPLRAEALPKAADFQTDALGVAAGADRGAAQGAAERLGPAERLEELWRAAAALQAHPPWPPRRVLACAKHLCGGATDIALRSLLRRGGVPAAVCIATCCHHRCDAASYVNLPFLEELGLLAREGDVERLASMAGWAVGGRGDVAARRRLGMMAKRVLDLGRVAWLRDTLELPDAMLVHYIGKEVTPENIAIIAGGGGDNVAPSQRA